MQFNIKKDATMPYLEMELIKDGWHDFNKCYVALQNAEIYFNMIDADTGVKRIVNAKANVVPIENNGCEEKVKIQYKWNKKDTKNTGIFKGSFKIIFNDDIVMEDVVFPTGELIVPIAEELLINIL